MAKQPPAEEPPAPPAWFPPGFIPVEEPGGPNRASLRSDGAGAKVMDTGRTLLNRKASNILYALLEQSPFDDFAMCGVFWGAHPERAQVVGRLVAPDVQGATPIRENKRKKLFTLYLNGVLGKHPTLREHTNTFAAVEWSRDGGYFTIYLGLSLQKRRAGGKSDKETGENAQGLTAAELAALKAATAKIAAARPAAPAQAAPAKESPAQAPPAKEQAPPAKEPPA